MKRILTILFLAVFFYGCSGNDDSAGDAGLEYTTVNAMNIIANPPQQAFVDRLSLEMQKIKDDSSYKIDTTTLTQLIDSAKQANDTRLAILKQTKQTDNDIQFRDKAIHYTMLLDSAYNNNFKKSIEILASDNKNKIDTLRQILFPILQEIKDAGNTMDAADSAMKAKYRIETVDPKDYKQQY